MKKDDMFLKKLLLREMEKEEEKIRKQVEQDEDLKDMKPSDDFMEKIMQKAEKLQEEQNAFRNLSKEDQEALMLGKELQLRREEKEKEEVAEELVPDPEETEQQMKLAAGGEPLQEIPPVLESDAGTAKRKVRKWKKRTMLALVAAIVAVLGVGVTTFGNGGYVVERVSRLLGGRKSTNITSESSESKDVNITTQEEINEEEIFQKVKDEFGFDAVRMDYKPIDMQMIDYVVDKSLLSADIYYEYKGQVLTYSIIPPLQNFSYGYDIEDPIVDEYVMEVNSVKINITEYLIEESNQTEYAAKFKYKDVEYIMVGIIEKGEFEKILKNLHFF